MPERRILDFASMDEIMPDVERLLEGHSTAGQWTPAQILHHPLGLRGPAARRGRFHARVRSCAIGRGLRPENTPHYQPRLGRRPIRYWTASRMAT